MNSRGLPEIAIGLGVVALAAVVVVSTAQLARPPAYAQVGPAVMPYAVAAGLALLGSLLLVQGFRGGWRSAAGEESGPTAASARVLWLVGGLVANALLMPWLGFILTSTLLFGATARAFGSMRPARDIAIGFAFAFAAHTGFARLLGIDLGGGVIEGLL
ncbi:MAG: tripartite tricarboxylate transporter TctB family protein [Alphaproteobacteria bacterium]|nr:tripartite tricarboxylate transporter TctB family protein [Alphaproteobacteria bacterium]